MKTANMTVLFNCLDSEVEKRIKFWEKECSYFITLYLDEETRSNWMSVLTIDCRTWNDIQLTEGGQSKYRTMSGIRNWFKAHGDEVKGG
jgi:hypothetical protein